VWTTAGVIVGVLLAGATGWMLLDPLVAIAVALPHPLDRASLLRALVPGPHGRGDPEPGRATDREVLDVLRPPAATTTSCARARPARAAS
jgi:hypothetical protein